MHTAITSAYNEYSRFINHAVAASGLPRDIAMFVSAYAIMTPAEHLIAVLTRYCSSVIGWRSPSFYIGYDDGDDRICRPDLSILLTDDSTKMELVICVGMTHQVSHALTAHDAVRLSDDAFHGIVTDLVGQHHSRKYMHASASALRHAGEWYIGEARAIYHERKVCTCALL